MGYFAIWKFKKVKIKVCFGPSNLAYFSVFIYLCLYICLITVYLNYLFAVNPIPTAIATVIVGLYDICMVEVEASLS